MYADAHSTKASLALLCYSIHSFAITSVERKGRTL